MSVGVLAVHSDSVSLESTASGNSAMEPPDYQQCEAQSTDADRGEQVQSGAQRRR